MLYRLLAPVPLSVKSSKHLNPRGAAFIAGAGPGFPSSELDKAVYVPGKAVREGVVKGTVEIVSHNKSTNVFQLLRVVIDRAGDVHLGARVLAVCKSVCLSPSFPLQFFGPVNCDNNFVDAGKPVPVKDLPAK